MTKRRFVVMLNPSEAEHDRKVRENILKHLEQRLEELKQLEEEPHTRAACALKAHPVYGRYIRETKTDRLQVNRVRVKTEERA